MPAIFLSHGAPPLVDDALWTSQLRAWAQQLARPQAILIVSAHWESAPVTLGAVADDVPLVHDFTGFDARYYAARYASPGAPAVADRVEGLLPASETVVRRPDRGLDHGAYVPLSVMYPEADVPVLQMSLPTLDPERLLELGRRLSPLRDEGVLIIGSGFTTHGLPFLRDWRAEAPAPTWSSEFDAWTADVLERGAVDELADFTSLAPGMPYAHPTTEHLAPLFVTLGAATDPSAPPEQILDGYWYGLAKRSVQVT
jgi:4,5-DOPA dioxygenase extradiol